MRRALKRAAQAFVAAGALGLVSPALAQSSHSVSKSQPAAAVKNAESAQPADAVPTAETTRDEMEVELAWLANKATFAHSLTAHVVGRTLEVHGFVPNTMVKDQAIKIAQRHTPLPVVDRVKVNTSVRVPFGGAPADELIAKANEVLADGLGDLAQGLEIDAQENGVVTLKGSVQSVEDKLTISRKMRQVQGCLAVVNQVTVAQALREGHLVTQVSADGSLILGNPSAPSLPVPAPTPTVLVTPPPLATPPAPKPVVVAPPPMVSPSPIATPMVVTPAPVVVTPSEHTGPTPAKPSGPQYSSGAVSTAPPTPLPFTTPALTRPDADKTPNPLDKKPIVTPAPSPVVDKPAAPKETTTTVAKLDTTPKITINDRPPVPAPVSPWTPPAKPAPMVATTTPLPPSGVWPAAHQEKAAATSYVTTGTVVFDEELTPAAPMPKPTTPAAPTVQTAIKTPYMPGSLPTTVTTQAPTVKPAATSGAMPMVTPAPSSTPTTTPEFATMPSSAAAKLKEKIEAVCGKQAKVQVTVNVDKSMKVLVQVADAKTEMMLEDKILQLPEMASPNVHFGMEVIGK